MPCRLRYMTPNHMVKINIGRLSISARLEREDEARMDTLARMLLRGMPSSVHIDRETGKVTYTVTKPAESHDRLGTRGETE